MPDIFDEVQEDLRAEQARRLVRRYSGAAGAVVVLILIGTGAGVWWRDRAHARDEAAAARYLAATRLADHGDAAALASLDAIARDGPEGYRTLARLRAAALAWDQGQHAQALAAWQAVAADGGAPPLLRDLATLTRLSHQLDGPDPQALKQQAESLTAPDNAWRPMAEQFVALLDLRMGRPAEAAGIMKRLSLDPLAAPGVRQMAGELLQTIDVPAPAPAPAHATPEKGPGTHG